MYMFVKNGSSSITGAYNFGSCSPLFNAAANSRTAMPIQSMNVQTYNCGPGTTQKTTVHAFSLQKRIIFKLVPPPHPAKKMTK